MRIAQALGMGVVLVTAACDGSGSTSQLLPGEATPLAFDSTRDGDEEIYVMRADGTGLVNVTNHPIADDRDPAWSPDRTRIACSSRPVGGSADEEEIYVVSVATGSVTQVTNDTSKNLTPCWSPDGAKIAYTAAPPLSDTSGLEIRVVNADGSGTPVSLGNGFQPAWSPDGTKIAYTSVADWPNDLDVHVMSAIDGSGDTNLTNDPDFSFSPAWSPDGTEIAFYSSINYLPPYSMLKMSSTGGPFQTVSVVGQIDPEKGRPCWSPDGSKFVFSVYSPDGYQLHILNADGTGHAVLLADPGVNYGGPDWSR